MNMTEKNIVGSGSTDQNLMVCLRIRPMNEEEIQLEVPLIAHCLEGNVVVLLDPMDDHDDILRANRSREKQFVFDCVFNSSASQEDVFNMSTQPLISQVIDGYTATVFAYGATGTGKTHTMLGDYDDPGIMMKALEALFQKMESLEDDLIFQVTISYLEVYNEMIRDLLINPSAILDLREDQNGVQVAGLSEIEVHNTDEVMEILSRGNAQRSVEATAANKHSSRSHAVLQVNIISRPRIRTGTHELMHRGRLFLIDLAGSERASNTLNRGKRMTEGAHINRSLLALGNCINALADPNTKRYVNYRDSKLTRLLKDALGGNCRTVMVAHISPTSPHFEDSRNTLVYADRAKHIRTKIHKNMYDVNFHLVQYNNIISELKLEINRLRNKLEMAQAPSDQDDVIKMPNHALRSSKKRSLRHVNSWMKTNSNNISMNEHVEEMKLKDQLLIAFQKHLNCKKLISENINNDMDLSLEESRCQLIIREWELKKAKRIPDRENNETDEETKNEEKQLELQGMDMLSENNKVKEAQTELTLAQNERQKLLIQRQKLETDLESHMTNVKQLEKLIPERVKPNRQSARQILELLCRLHRLEARQTELQTENLLLRQYSTRHDLTRTALLRHCDLCAQIIESQQAQIDLANNAAGPSAPDQSKELQMLLQLYNRDGPAAAISLTTNNDLVDMDKRYFPSISRIVEPQGTSDSISDLRDMTTNVSIHEITTGLNEEKESTSSVPVIDTNHNRNTPDTWDVESLQPNSVKHLIKSISDERPTGSNNQLSIMGVKPNFRSNYNPNQQRSNPTVSKNQILLPGIQGRQIIEPLSSNYQANSLSTARKANNNRSRSLEPVYMSSMSNRRRMMPRLDPLGNTVFDPVNEHPPSSSHNNRYPYQSQNKHPRSRYEQYGGAAGSMGMNPPRFSYGSSGKHSVQPHKKQQYKQRFNPAFGNTKNTNYRVPKSSAVNASEKSSYRMVQKDRASEIRKLNEKRFPDENFMWNDEIENL